MDAKEYARLAWLFNYRLRPNYPTAGAWPQGQFDLYRKLGAPLFNVLPDKPGMTEADATAIQITDQMYNEAAPYKGNEYFQFETPNDIDKIAAVAEFGHGVPIIFYSRYDEWAREYPVIIDPTLQNRADNPVRHCVCVLPNSSFVENGTRYVTVQDSALFAGLSLRHVSEDFIKARVFGGGYWDSVQLLGGGSYPTHVFTKAIKYGDTGPEVLAMQQLFVAERVLPADCLTGNFRGRTLAALHAFQNKHAADILVPLKLTAPTDTFGSMSIKVANILCRPH